MIYIKRLLYYLLVSLRPHKSKTVKFAFPIAFFSLAIIAATIVSNQTSSVRIVSDKTALKANDTFNISVYANATIPINAIDIEVYFPKDQIKIESINTGRSVITFWAFEPYVKDNKVILSGGTLRKGFLGEHLIVSMKARAITSGIAEFTISNPLLVASDGNGTFVKTEKDNVELTINVGEKSISAPAKLEGRVDVRITTDIDGDGKVTMADINAFISAWRNQHFTYDFNNDKTMTFRDFAIILADFFFKR